MSTSAFTVSRPYRAARIIGHLTWWVFVVALVARESSGATGARRYADYLSADDDGWSAFTAFTSVHDICDDSNVLATTAFIALVVCVLAAGVEAVLGRAWLPGIVTVSAPILGAVVVYIGAEARNGGVWQDVYLRPTLATALILVGVAVREVWARGFAPKTVAVLRS